MTTTTEEPPHSHPQDDSLAKAGYEGYCGSSGGRSVIYGDELPAWEHLAEPVQKAWVAAAQAVVNAYEAESAPDTPQENA